MNPNSIEQIRKKYPARITRSKAIKLYCKELCCCGDLVSWRNCEQKSCFLWAFRQGKECLGNTTSSEKGKKKHRQNVSLLENPSNLQDNSTELNKNGGLK